VPLRFCNFVLIFAFLFCSFVFALADLGFCAVVIRSSARLADLGWDDIKAGISKISQGKGKSSEGTASESTGTLVVHVSSNQHLCLLLS